MEKYAILRAEIGVERGLPHRNEKDHVALLAGVLLCGLHFDGLRGVLQRGEERRDWLAYLEVDRAVFDLNDDVGLKGAVERGEVVESCPGTVGLQILPVEVVVVDETAVQNDAMVRLQSSGKDVGRLRRRSAVLRWASSSFRVCFDDEAAEVWDEGIDLVDFLLPPGDNGGIEWIEEIGRASCRERV